MPMETTVSGNLLQGGRAHHPKINELKRSLQSYGVRCKYFNRDSLFVDSVIIRGHVRKGFLIRFTSTVVPGARWTVNYFTIVQHSRDTVNVPAFASLIPKLLKYNFISPYECHTKQTSI